MVEDRTHGTVRLAHGGAGRLMGHVNCFIKYLVFDAPGDCRHGRSFDAACKELHDTCQPDMMREVIAEQIIELATTDKFDPVRLREAALVWGSGYTRLTWRRTGQILAFKISQREPAEHSGTLSALILVSRFRSSHHSAASSFANFGIVGH